MSDNEITKLFQMVYEMNEKLNLLIGQQQEREKSENKLHEQIEKFQNEINEIKININTIQTTEKNTKDITSRIISVISIIISFVIAYFR